MLLGGRLKTDRKDFSGFAVILRGNGFAVRAVVFLLLLVAIGASARGQVNVYTRSYDNNRSGANLQETTLTPANVNTANFGKLFTVHTDGQIYAQPLYVSNLTINGGSHNVLLVASMRNTVYAIDADSGTILWQQNFGTPIVPQEVENDQNIVWSTGLGILGTPVIDPATNYMYFLSGEEPTSKKYSWNLNAIDIATGQPVHGSPVTVQATYTTADLTAPLTFDAGIHNPRPGLALANGNVYISFASHNDIHGYRGWVMAYSTSTLAQTAVYVDTTVGVQGGIWSAGQAPTVDSSGNVYISTGNGSFGTTTNNLVQTGNSFIKLSPTLQLLDYFTPYNSANLNAGDQDLGSSGLLLIPNTNYVLGGGKQGVLYLSDTTNMGKFNASSDQVKQEFQAIYGTGSSHIHGGPIYFSDTTLGPIIYAWGENDHLRAFNFDATAGKINTTPFAQSTMTAPATNNNGAMPGGFLAVSANQNHDGIVWASTPYNGDAVHASTQGVVYAFDATTLKKLWSDKDNEARDEVGMFAKYVPPVVANGKMYIPNFGPVGSNDGTGNLIAYGLLNQMPTLTVSADNATRAFGADNPSFTGTVTGAQSGDTFTETFATTADKTSAVGSYPITPTAAGTNLGNYTVKTVNGNLTVTPAATTTSVSAPATATTGASVTITATVSSTAGTPGGSVTFAAGSTQLGTATLANGVASVSTTALPQGSNTVTATYAAAGNFDGSSGTADVVISAPPPGAYALSASPTSLTVQAGKSGSTMLTFTPTNQYKGNIALSCTNLPANATCSFAQTNVTLNGDNAVVTTMLTLNATAQTSSRRTSSNSALLAVAFWWPGGLAGLTVFFRKRKSTMPGGLQLGILLLCAVTCTAALSGCGSGSGSSMASGGGSGSGSGSGSGGSGSGSGGGSGSSQPTTSNVNVVATDAAGTQTVVLSLTVTQ
jgi:hypothetical protein